MNEKVYPVVADEAHGRPSAPPLGLSPAPTAVAIQRPEKAIHKEQEQSLLPNQFRSQYDQKYYERPPVPVAAGAARPVGRGRRRGRRSSSSCCCCCLASFVGTLATIAVIVGIAALIIYLVLKPKVPKFAITEATINEFKLRTSPAPGKSDNFKLDTDFTLSIEARNPNKISLYYDDVDVTLFYAESQQIGKGSIPPFHQPHQNTTFLTLPIQGQNMPLTSSSGSALQSNLKNDASIPLQAEAVTKARVKVGGWKSRRYKIYVICSFQVNMPRTSSPSAHIDMASKSCKLKLKIAHIKLTFK